MNIKSKFNTTNIKDLLNVTYTIQKGYDQLIQAKIKNDQESYQEILQTLNVCFELENSIYQKLNIDITTCDPLSDQIAIVNEQQNRNAEDKREALERIDQYLISHHYINPFLSENEDTEIFQSENMITIINQYNWDYIQLIIYLLDQKIQDKQYHSIKKNLIREKYKLIFENKIFESIFLTENYSKPILDGRTRALAFHQREEFIEELFLEKTETIINHSINSLINIPYIIYKTPANKETMEQLHQINLICALELLQDQELGQIYHQIYKEIFQNPNFTNDPKLKETLDTIIRILNERIEYPNKYTRKRSKLPQ